MRELDPEVRALLVCPECRGELMVVERGLACPRCRVVYPVVEGVPWMIPERAKKLRQGELRVG